MHLITVHHPLTCPKCGNQSHFGYPPVCVGEMNRHATCYECTYIFEYDINNTKFP